LPDEIVITGSPKIAEMIRISELDEVRLKERRSRPSGTALHGELMF
jgi:hypothetical protein